MIPSRLAYLRFASANCWPFSSSCVHRNSSTGRAEVATTAEEVDIVVDSIRRDGHTARSPHLIPWVCRARGNGCSSCVSACPKVNASLDRFEPSGSRVRHRVARNVPGRPGPQARTQAPNSLPHRRSRLPRPLLTPPLPTSISPATHRPAAVLQLACPSRRSPFAGRGGAAQQQQQGHGQPPAAGAGAAAPTTHGVVFILQIIHTVRRSPPQSSPSRDALSALFRPLSSRASDVAGDASSFTHAPPRSPRRPRRVHQGVTDRLRALLADPSVEKCGCGSLNDAHKLFRDYGAAVRGAVELSDVAALKFPELARGGAGATRQSLAALAARALGAAVEKPNALRCGDWEQRVLSRRVRLLVAASGRRCRCLSSDQPSCCGANRHRAAP